MYRFDFTKDGSGTGQVSDRNYALFLYKSSGTFTEGSGWDGGNGQSDNVFITGDARKVNLNKKPYETNTIPLISVENVYARSRNDYKYRSVAVSPSESVVTMGDVSYVWRDGYAAKGTPVTGDTLMAGKTSIFATGTTKGAFNLMYGTAETESSAEFINQINVGTTVTVEQADGLNKVKTPRQNNGNATPFEDGTRSVSVYYNAPTVAAQNDSTMQSVTLTDADSGNDKGRTLTYGASGDTNFGITETWVNTPKSYDITITKQLTDSGQSVAYGNDNQEFTVQITLTNVFGVAGNDVSGYTAITKTSSDSARNGTLSGGSTTGTFKIKAGETVTIPDVPYGTGYSIQELSDGVNTSVYTTLDTAVKSGTVTGTTAITISNAKGTAANDQFTLTVAKKWSLLDKDALTDAGITSVKYQLQRTISKVTDAASYAVASWEDVGSVFTVGTSDTVTGANTTNVTWSKSLGTYDVKDGGGNVYTYRIIEYAQDDTALIYKNEGWYNGECQALYTFEESNTTKNNYALAGKNATTELAIKNQYRSISSGQPLPKTGARGVYAIVTFGAFAIIIAGVALLIYRKKLQTVNIYAVKGSEKKKE